MFVLYKLRSMRVDPENGGPVITSGDDPRVTPVGRVLRRWKIDELPQLINVLQGDLSLVGPRPEDPRFVALYTDEQRRVLSVRPGLTGVAAIAYRHEAELFCYDSDPERRYVEYVMPEKLRLELAYLDRASVRTDIVLLAKTVAALARRQ